MSGFAIFLAAARARISSTPWSFQIAKIAAAGIGGFPAIPEALFGVVSQHLQACSVVEVEKVGVALKKSVPGVSGIEGRRPHIKSHVAGFFVGRI